LAPSPCRVGKISFTEYIGVSCAAFIAPAGRYHSALAKDIRSEF
jgi:hypothetical protein